MERRSRAAAGLCAALVAGCGAAEPRTGQPPESLIAFTSRGIWVVPADGGRRVTLSAPYRRTRRTELRPVWSPDGARIAFRGYLERDARSGGAAYHIHVMEPDGSGVVNLTRRHFREAGEFDWSPDGESLVVDVWNERVDRHRLHVIRTDGGPPRRLTAGDDFAPRWSPDGSTLAFSRFTRGGKADLYAIGADGTGLRRLARSANGPAWSPDGSRVAFFTGSQPARIELIDLRDGARTTLATQRGGVGELAWSPDGSAIAYALHRRRTGWDIRLLDAQTGHVSALTSDGGDEYGPAWSPDGNRIAFEHSRVGGGRDNTGTYDVNVVNADGTGRRRLTRCRCTMGGGISWQPAG